MWTWYVYKASDNADLLILCFLTITILTYGGLVTSYADMDLGRYQHRHQAITWNNVDLSSVNAMTCILGKISQKIPWLSINEIINQK